MTKFQSFDAARAAIRAALPTQISRWLEERYHLRFGETELLLLPCLCDSERDAIDVGANEGSYTLFLRKYAHHVHAFEPIPSLAEQLAHKFDTDVTVWPVGLSRSTGSASLHIPIIVGEEITGLASVASASTDADGYHDIMIQTNRLDDVYGGDAGFIKIDVEGHERAVLDGARGTIMRCRPNVLVELEERHTAGAVELACRYFSTLAYAGYFVRHGAIFSIEQFDIETMQRAPYMASLDRSDRRIVRRDYTNNFIFLPMEQTDAVVGLMAEELANHHRE